MDHELWITKLFNDSLASLANSVLRIFNLPAQPRPWANFLTMEILVFVLIVLLVAAVKRSFSVDKPGRLQHLFEVLYEFLNHTAEEVGLHHGRKYIPYFGTLFIF